MSLYTFPWIAKPEVPTTNESILEAGKGDKNILFLHGLFGSPQHWSGIMQGLASDYRSLAPQLPIDRQGNRRKEGAKTIGDLTSLIESTINRTGLEQFVLCGNSLGGLIAIDFALRHPNRVLGLVLAGSAGLYERSLTKGEKPKPTREFVRSVISDIFYDERLINDALVDEWYDLIQDRDYARFILRISRATRDRCVVDELDQLTMPTLIVWGRNDEITPPSVAEQFQAQIRGAELKFIDQCGHSPNLEQPEAFMQHMSEFLPRCFAGAPLPNKPR